MAITCCKSDIIEATAAKTGIDKDVVAKVLTEAMAAIIHAASRDAIVKINNFGTFTPVLRAARKARNPRTGEMIDVPPKNTCKFAPSDYFSQRMN